MFTTRQCKIITWKIKKDMGSSNCDKCLKSGRGEEESWMELAQKRVQWRHLALAIENFHILLPKDYVNVGILSSLEVG
jgi:hypothetical protein